MNLPDRERWRQLSPLLDELIELGPDARSLRLSELRAVDASAAAELESLLDAAGQADAALFLSGSVAHDSADATLAGRTIGAYVIESPLGQGATGSVWRARRADGRFEGSVAIKLLHLSLVGHAGAQRFEREGAILARLTHPNIARLLDAGVTADGQPYLVLEMIQGERIDAYCDAAQLSIEQRLALFDAVMAAVAHAHSQLVIHRDLKPNNILVSAEGTVKLLDFGIARLLQDEGGDLTQTADGRRALTPLYAAPEQVLGKPVSTATDVYALGVLLFRLLAGRHPTAGPTGSDAELLRATLQAEPLRLSKALTAAADHDEDSPEQVASRRATTVARLQRRLAGDLDNIVAQALRKDAAQRYQTVGALAEDLRRHREHEPIAARPDGALYRAGKFVRRYRRAVLVGMALALAIGTGLVGTVTQARRAQAQAERAQALTLQAQRQRDRARQELAAAEAFEEFMEFLLASAADKPFTASELLLRGEAMARRQFADDPALRARLLLSLANLTSELDEDERTRVLLQEAEAAARESGVPSLQALASCAYAGELTLEPDEARAAAAFEKALRRLATDPDADPSLLATCLNQRAFRSLTRDDAVQALQDSQAALRLLQNPRPGRSSLVLAARMSQAFALSKTGDMAGAIAAQREALSSLVAMGRAQTLGASTFHSNLSLLLFSAGDQLESLAESEQALRIAGGPAGEGLNSASLLTNHAGQLLAVGRTSEAVAFHERALKVARQRNDPLTAGMSMASFNHCPAGRAEQCRAQLQQTQRELARMLPPTHEIFAAIDARMAGFELARQQWPAAQALMQRALSVLDALKHPPPMRIRLLGMLATAEAQQGLLDRAEAHAAQAVAQARADARGLAHSSWLGGALTAQGIVQHARGQTDAARESWRAALAELRPTMGEHAPATREVLDLLSRP